MKCHDIPQCGKFKLSILGIFISFLLILSGLFPTISDYQISLPVIWIIAIIILIPSTLLYYSVKEEFWAAVIKSSTQDQKGSSVD